MSERCPSSRPVDEVVDAVATTADERERAREALDPVTDGDHVTHEAVTTAVSDTAKLVATAETRVELAGIAVEDAAAAAADHRDLRVVDARMETAEERLADVERRAASLGDMVPAPDDTLAPEAVHDLALDLRAAATTAQTVAQTADDLSWDLEQFESWLESAARRHEAFREDMDLLEESTAALEAQAETVDDDPEEPAVAWAAATVQARVHDLLVSDLRAELTALRTLADRQGEAVPDELSRRVDAVDREVTAVVTQLDDQGEAAWRERFADELGALQEGLADLEPPVEWGRVEELASEQRQAIGVE